MKEIQAMSERELLEELVASKRRAEKWEKLKLYAAAALLLIVVVLAAVYVPRLAATMRRVNDTMDKVQTMSAEAQELFDGVREIGMDKLAETVENVNKVSEEAGEIVETIKSVGVENIQKALEDLSALAERLRGFFGR